jgi:hypothetical protein
MRSIVNRAYLFERKLWPIVFKRMMHEYRLFDRFQRLVHLSVQLDLVVEGTHHIRDRALNGQRRNENDPPR